MRTIKDGLYNYLSQHNTKRFKVLVAVLFLSVVVLISLFVDEIFNDQNLYYYTFSTIVQGFLALVAFLGAVVIYKLQIIETDLNSIRNELEPDLEYFFGMPAKTYSWIESMNKARETLDNTARHHEHNKDIRERIEIHWKRLDELSKERGNIRKKMVDFSLFSFFNVGFSLISMPITRMLTEGKMYAIGEVFILIGIVASCFSLFFAFKIIRAVLGYSFTARL